MINNKLFIKENDKSIKKDNVVRFFFFNLLMSIIYLIIFSYNKNAYGEESESESEEDETNESVTELKTIEEL